MVVLSFALPVQAQDPSPALPATAAPEPAPAASAAPVPEDDGGSSDSIASARDLVLEQGELEQGVAMIARLRESGRWSRAELATLLELEAYARFGLEDEGAWTRALQELATLDPGRTLPSFYPLPLTRVLASFSATARSLTVSLEHTAFEDRVEVIGSLLHDEANLLRRLTLRERTVGDPVGWREHDLAPGRLVLRAAAGSELELEAIAIGPNEVELARSGVDLVAVPRHLEAWDQDWFWPVVAGSGAAVGLIVGLLVYVLTQTPELALTTRWNAGM